MCDKDVEVRPGEVSFVGFDLESGLDEALDDVRLGALDLFSERRNAIREVLRQAQADADRRSLARPTHLPFLPFRHSRLLQWGPRRSSERTRASRLAMRRSRPVSASAS